MGLVAGERLTVEQLLWGLLIPSGNDAAMALARHSAGSVDAFVERMNQRSQALGLRQTHFANPHGLDATGHVSSAADLLALTRQLWGYPLFREIVQTAEITIAGHPLRSTNELLTTFSGANGVKTGTSDAAGQCLLASIERNDHLLWIIVLGSQDRYADTRALVAHAEANYSWATGNPNELSALNRVYGENGTVWYLRAVGAPPALLVHPWETSQLRAYRRLQLPPSELPWQPGMEVGMLEWLLDDKIVGRQSLVLW
jgi:D-alanyl-D-alanine carboxypeptidase (penicillin-binding protein 5/6)